MKYFCRSKYNHVKSGVLKKHIYLALQYDELLAVLVQIYRIKTHQKNVPNDQLAVFPKLLHFFKIKFYV